MKKIIAIFISALMAVSFVSCKKSDKKSTSSKAKSSSSVSVDSENKYDNSKYKCAEPFGRYLKMFSERNAQYMVDFLPESLVEYSLSTDYYNTLDDILASQQKTLDKEISDIEADIGTITNVSGEITEEAEIDSTGIADIKASWTDSGVELGDVDEGYKITCNIYFTGVDEKQPMEGLGLTFFKMSGKWKMITVGTTDE